MIGQRMTRAREEPGYLTKPCKAVTVNGPCRVPTSLEHGFCHLHEWRAAELVMGARQAFVMTFPAAVAKLVKLIDEPDGELALKAIIVYMKYMFGDKPVAEGMQPMNDLGHLTNEELIERVQRAVAALQPPSAVAE